MSGREGDLALDEFEEANGPSLRLSFFVTDQDWWLFRQFCEFRGRKPFDELREMIRERTIE